MIADTSGVMTITLREEKLDVLLVVLKWYKPTNFMIQDFNMTKNLTLCRQDSNIEELDDTGPVQENTEHLYLEKSNYILELNL